VFLDVAYLSWFCAIVRQPLGVIRYVSLLDGVLYRVNIQRVPLNVEHLDTARIKLYSSITFVLTLSVYSPLAALYFRKWSISSRKIAYRLFFQHSREQFEFFQEAALPLQTKNWPSMS
jgi:hypothetical protein